jgi:hypothetical protein
MTSEELQAALIRLGIVTPISFNRLTPELEAHLVRKLRAADLKDAAEAAAWAALPMDAKVAAICADTAKMLKLLKKTIAELRPVAHLLTPEQRQEIADGIHRNIALVQEGQRLLAAI